MRVLISFLKTLLNFIFSYQKAGTNNSVSLRLMRWKFQNMGKAGHYNNIDAYNYHTSQGVVMFGSNKKKNVLLCYLV